MKLILLILTFFYASDLLAGDRIFISNWGITNHGVPVNPELAEQMPNKIDKEGNWVYHDKLTVEYQPHKSSLFFGASYLRDCFFKRAAFIGVGQQFEHEVFSYGYILGMYARERLVFIDKNGNRATPAELPIPIGQERGDFQYAPMGFLTIAATKKFENVDFRVSAGSNFFLSHFQAGLVFTLREKK